MPNSPAPLQVFCSYAHEDTPHLQNLHTHLATLQRQNLISTWHDRQIPPGTNWAHTIDTHLEQASLILLLVSPDFLASKYCYEIEMQRALQRHAANQARVIPLILRPCDWRHTPLASLQCLPLDGKPLTTWDNQDQAWHDIASGIRRAIEDLTLLATSIPQATSPSIWNIPYPATPSS